MKKLLVVLILILMAVPCWAGTIIDRVSFLNGYDPVSTDYTYSQPGGSGFGTATGNQVAVNTYTRKSIQVSPTVLGEYVEIQIEGRFKDQVNTPNWAVLDTVAFGQASADTSKNVVVDVSEYVDFLRIGIRQKGTNAESHIDIKGLFTNLER